MDSLGGHTTNALPKILLRSLIDIVNIYEESVGETPKLSAKSSINNSSLNASMWAKTHHADPVS